MRPALLACCLILANAAEAQEALSGAAFAADLRAQQGKLIAVTPCNILPIEISGNYACRLLQADGSDALGPDGQPVSIFFAAAALGEAQKAFLTASCEPTWCPGNVTLTGKAGIAEGIDYVFFTEVRIAPAP